jgi:DNA-binding transcriptional MerR regulator
LQKQDFTTMATTYTISDLAKEFDLTTRAMRFYEDMGLLQPQREGAGGRNRVYTARDRTRLKLTLRAKRLGLSLVEAKEIIDSYDSPRDTAPQLKKFLAILTEHRKKLEAQMLDLQANLDEIRTHEKEAKALLVKTEKAKPANPEAGCPGADCPRAGLGQTTFGGKYVIIDVYVNVNQDVNKKTQRKQSSAPFKRAFSWTHAPHRQPCSSASKPAFCVKA